MGPSKQGVGLFLGGMVVGVAATALVVFLVLGSMVRHPGHAVRFGRRFGLTQRVERVAVERISRVVFTVPRDVIAVRKDRLDRVFGRLTQAYAENRLTFQHVQRLVEGFYRSFEDRSLTASEIDGLLDLADSIVR